MRKQERKVAQMATPVVRRKPLIGTKIPRARAEKIADLVINAVEKKLAELPKEDRIAKRDEIIAFLDRRKAKR